MKITKNKKGWIKIVEASTMIIILTGMFLLILSGDRIKFSDNSEVIYEIEKAIIREIQLNNTLRNTVLESSVPLEWENFPSQLKSHINQSEILDCSGKICVVESECILTNPPDKNIYVQSAIISANTEIYNPRKLAIFCWEKEG
ncbi:hypothetical protein J4407_02375 [Candidatus Pacearchaeota archaeon]|nr:hypothetical protein [Candidatus Pacearchaeota archaeon]